MQFNFKRLCGVFFNTSIRSVAAGLAGGLAFGLASGTSFADGGDSSDKFTLDLGGVCAYWRLYSGPDLNTLVDPKALDDCEEYGDGKSYLGNCSIDLKEGSYRLLLGAMSPNLLFTVGKNALGETVAWEDDLDTAYSMEVFEKRLTLRTRILDVSRNGYKGFIGFEHQVETPERCDIIGKNSDKTVKMHVPVGSFITLSYNWMGLHQSHRLGLGQLSTRVRIGDKGAPLSQAARMTYQTTNGENAYMRLYPVDVTYTPDVGQEMRQWTIASAFAAKPFDLSQMQTGKAMVKLLPGTNFSLWVKNDDGHFVTGHFAFRFDKCDIYPFPGNPKIPFLDPDRFRVSEARRADICRMKDYSAFHVRGEPSDEDDLPKCPDGRQSKKQEFPLLPSPCGPWRHDTGRLP